MAKSKWISRPCDDPAVIAGEGVESGAGEVDGDDWMSNARQDGMGRVSDYWAPTI